MERLIKFLKRICGVFEEINRQQQEKLKVLTEGTEAGGRQLTIQQASDKQLQYMEQQRLALFRELGIEGKTLKKSSRS